MLRIISFRNLSSLPLDWHEFHVSRRARDKYAFDQALFATDGRVLLADFQAAQKFADQINNQRRLEKRTDFVRAGELNALGLIDEIWHTVIAQFRAQKNPQLFANALQVLAEQNGDSLDATLLQFVEEFPPLAVYRDEITPRKYLQSTTNGVAHREIVLEELLILWLTNANPAALQMRELFDDSTLATQTPYPKIIEGLHTYLAEQEPFGPDGQNLFDLLQVPFAQDSLSAQLRWLSNRWIDLLGAQFPDLLRGLDWLSEEEKPSFHGPGPSLVPDYGRARLRSEVEMDEPERFSDDRAWMPRAVVVAKNAYVWLEQLCRKYQAPIYQLGDIPDEELDELQEQGFTGLWLIGLWERSVASKTIKQSCGNPEAEASAYSLKRYEIADDLGGWPALDDLRARALQRGIRMASDMVPNHMGIDADWVINHPDWFVSTDKIPFSTYTFTGQNLSPEPHIGIFLEDGYYSKTEAAVVFQRIDYATNDVRYVYHGNDGTLIPWNDTAQLNYLMSEVREAVVQTILHVARHFPIIRFDAAMTLAKRHYQRLWFPEPGTGGDIASRSWFGLTMDEFDALMPEEFWREVVDRVAQEAPDTLLLAEAFWMMEGYFVRSLGMHRVYNSAFMNMLRDEENQNYRLTLKNTLEFDPDILKRFVNFVNNPDEETAIDQFGDGDKYFGVCTMMATLPGLPMFGHGQVEGLHEKYGMEYRQAKWHETPNEWLVERHEREIFPLLHCRRLFAEVNNFALFDFFHVDGGVDENVFAYANRDGEDRALVIYNNRFGDTKGWIRTSAAAFDKGAGELRQKTLQSTLGVSDDADTFLIMSDVASGLEWIRSSRELCERGLYVELGAYGRHVWIDLREVQDEDGRYAHLHHELNGRGVGSIEIALRESELVDLHAPFDGLLSADLLRRLMPAPHFLVATLDDSDAEIDSGLPRTVTRVEDWEMEFSALDSLETRALEFFRALNEHQALQLSVAQLVADVRARAAKLQAWAAQDNDLRPHVDNLAAWSLLLSHAIVADLPEALAEKDAASTCSAVLDDWLLGNRLQRAFVALGMDEFTADQTLLTLKITLDFPKLENDEQWAQLFGDENAARLLGVNRHQGVTWFNREAWEQLAFWLSVQSLLDTGANDATQVVKALDEWRALCERAQAANYQLEPMLPAYFQLPLTAQDVSETLDEAEADEVKS